MLNAKAEELKKLVTVPDYKESSYEHLNLSELSFLRKQARALKLKNMTHAQNGQFFKRREDFFFQTSIRRLQKIEKMYVVTCPATSLPYVVCDPVSCNDQIWMFDNESAAKMYINQISSKNHLPLAITAVEKQQLLPFYISLFFLGVNELLINPGEDSWDLGLESLVKKPDFSKQPADRRPSLNPPLLLTACYFAQTKALPEEERNAEQLRELEEEMVMDILRGKIIIPVQLAEGATEMKPENMRFPMIKLSNGKQYQPICSDTNELMRFSVGQPRIHGLTIDGANLLKVMVKEADGVLLNPKTVKLAIPKGKF